MVTVSTFPNFDSLIDAAARRFTDVVNAIHSDPNGGVGNDGIARVVLTGGSAGIRLLKALRDAFIDWSRVEVFFGDERNVPRTDPDSNEGQAREALLDHVDIPEVHIHGYGLDGGDMNQAVARYEKLLREYAPNGFDIHLLGMGPEGHINSLFPHTAAAREAEHLVFAVTDSPKPPAQRVTLTLPAVGQSSRVWLLVSGKEKAEAAGHVAHSANPVDWPAAGAQGRNETLLFLSSDAAGYIG